MTHRTAVGLVLVSMLSAAACGDNGNDVGYVHAESAGAGGSAPAGGGGMAESTGGSVAGSTGNAGAGGNDATGGGNTGGAGSGGTGGVTGGTGGTGGSPTGGTGGVTGGTGGTGGSPTGGTGGATGGTGGTGGSLTGGAGGATGGSGGATGGSGGAMGGTGGAMGGTGGCPPLPSCNWCGGEDVKDATGCVTGWICANGIDPCTGAGCVDREDCAANEVCGDDQLCWPDEPTRLDVSYFTYVASPCTTDPCLPGMVAAITELGTEYIIVIDGHWVEPGYDWETEWGFNELDGQPTMAAGVVTYHTDINGAVYLELELTSLTYRLG